MRVKQADPARLESCACFNLRKAARAVTRMFDEALAPSGLAATQFTVLAALAVGRRFSMSELAELLDTDRTTLTRNLRPLTRAHLVRIELGQDRRSRLLELTPSGRRKLREAFPLWKQTQASTVTKFGRRRFSRLLGDLDALRGARAANASRPA